MGSGESTVVISRQPVSYAKHDLTVCHVYNHCILICVCMYVQCLWQHMFSLCYVYNYLTSPRS